VADYDRQTLWSVAEAAERRGDAVVAREIVLALPFELDESSRIELAENFARWLIDRHRVAIDLAIHSPDRRGDPRNFHAHLLLTTRRVEVVSGLPKLGEKTRELDTAKSGGEHITAWRGEWERRANCALAAAGKREKIDMRSHLARAPERGGVVYCASEHLGPARTAAARRGKPGTTAKKNKAKYALRDELERVAADLRAALPDPSPYRYTHPPARRAPPRNPNSPTKSVNGPAPGPRR